MSEQRLAGLQHGVVSAVRGAVDAAKHCLVSLVQRVPVATALYMQGQHHRLDLCQKYMDAASPEHILALGYSITRVNGKAVRSVDDIVPGCEITTTVAGGEFRSVVKK